MAFNEERSVAIIVGDLNAEHGQPEIDLLSAGGFGDAVDQTGLRPARNTSPVPGPIRRIDYILISPDLQASNARIPEVEASDHLPIAVDLQP